MPRVTVTPTVVPGPYEAVPHAELAFAAGDAANGNQVRLTGNQILVAHNTGAGARTITIASVSLKGRTGDITAFSIPAGKHRVFAKFPQAGWAQSTGYLNVNVEHAEVQLAVIDLASQSAVN